MAKKLPGLKRHSAAAPADEAPVSAEPASSGDAPVSPTPDGSAAAPTVAPARRSAPKKTPAAPKKTPAARKPAAPKKTPAARKPAAPKKAPAARKPAAPKKAPAARKPAAPKKTPVETPEPQETVVQKAPVAAPGPSVTAGKGSSVTGVAAGSAAAPAAPETHSAVVPEPQAEPSAAPVANDAVDGAVSAAADTPIEASARTAGARGIVERHGRYAIAGGAVPLPGLDIAAVAAIQVRMLQRLAAHYDADISDERARTVVMALMGSVTPHALGGAARWLIGPSLPVVGWLGALAGGGAAAHVITRVMGELFVDHFETGAPLDSGALKAGLQAA